MASLSYEILTDPAPLQVPEPGGESRGAVYIVVTNQTGKPVTWGSIEVRVPVGTADGDLTSVPTTINARVEQNTATTKADEPTASRDVTTGSVRVTPRNNAPFKKDGSLVLVLDGFPVSATPGVVLLRIEERPPRGAARKSVVLSLLKRAPAVPRNFRADKSLVAAGKDVVLRWEGPDALLYEVQAPDGSTESVPPRTGTGATSWQWSPKQGTEPNRDATYTLTAKTAPGQQPQHVLTTTVHLQSPEFDTLTATTAVHTPQVQGTTGQSGQVTFTRQGAQIHDDTGALGTLTADKAQVKDLETEQAHVTGQLNAAKIEMDEFTAGKAWVRTYFGSDEIGVNKLVAGQTRVNGLTAGQAEMTDLTVARVRVDEQLIVRGEGVVQEFLAGQARVSGKLTTSGPLEFHDQAGNVLLETIHEQPFGLAVHGGLTVWGRLMHSG
ncbi:MAG TPA: hypothetical protein VLH10_19575 [Yinghuangia sp.]|nr:hypothetical protein [Yinghuangia sp.]